jgi:hypothetical protein
MRDVDPGLAPLELRTRHTRVVVLREFTTDYIWRGVRSGPGVLYPPKRFVYIIRSVSEPERRSVGVTANPEAA